MGYYIYSVVHDGNTIINMTGCPEIDAAYLKAGMNVSSIEILTPELSISQAEYIMRRINRKHRGSLRFIIRGRNQARVSYMEEIKYAMSELNIRPSKAVRFSRGGVMPDESQKEYVYNLLKGRALDRTEINDILEKNSRFTGGIDEALQILYLEHKIDISPSIVIEEGGRRFICSRCLNVVPEEEASNGGQCRICGAGLDFEEPIFKESLKKNGPGHRFIKYKDIYNMTVPESSASRELLSFLDEQYDECLLWFVPGSENLYVFLKPMKKVIERGGRCLLSFSGDDDRIKFYDIASKSFMNAGTVINGKSYNTGDESITLCGFNEISSYYKAFDLVILYETRAGKERITGGVGTLAKEVLRDGGKLIISTTIPDNSLYERAMDMKIRLVTLPIREHMNPIPEPRIITHRFLGDIRYCFSKDIVDFIMWSIKNSMKIHIIVPYEHMAEGIYERLKESLLTREYEVIRREEVIVSTISDFSHSIEGENVIVMFADDKAFDERALIYASGLAGRSRTQAFGEVIFAGQRESDEMYNTKMMLRYLNKTAWEMGYLK